MRSKYRVVEDRKTGRLYYDTPDGYIPVEDDRHGRSYREGRYDEPPRKRRRPVEYESSGSEPYYPNVYDDDEPTPSKNRNRERPRGKNTEKESVKEAPVIRNLELRVYNDDISITSYDMLDDKLENVIIPKVAKKVALSNQDVEDIKKVIEVVETAGITVENLGNNIPNLSRHLNKIICDIAVLSFSKINIVDFSRYGGALIKMKKNNESELTAFINNLNGLVEDKTVVETVCLINNNSVTNYLNHFTLNENLSGEMDDKLEEAITPYLNKETYTLIDTTSGIVYKVISNKVVSVKEKM